MINKNKVHWENVGKSYSEAWASSAKVIMSKKESGFILKYANLAEPKSILDLGVGNGRILEIYINNSFSKIYGIDISKSMIQICLDKFKGKKELKAIKLCDISKEKIPYYGNFDFISAIRILKYNKNWKSIIGKIKNKLNDGGIFVFTMPNELSLNIFGRANLKYYRTNYKEIVKLIKENNLKLLEIRTFTRIPDIFYDLSNNPYYSKFIEGLEGLFEFLFGKSLFGRMFFIAVKNPNPRRI